MKEKFLLCVLFFAAICCPAEERRLEPVFHDDTCQFTGVAISHTGRMFVNYPRWQSEHKYDVVEVLSNGMVRPYPDPEWNAWTEKSNASNHWVCVQAVYVDDQDELWVVDPASPEMKGVKNDGAKLVCIDLETGAPIRTYNLTYLVGDKSYLNDIRVDLKTSTAYLTESAKGGIVVLNIQRGEARLVLADHYSVKSDPHAKLIINGAQLKRDGKPFKVNSDGIALSPDRQWLYYKPLSDMKLYRIRTEDLRNPALDEKDLEKRVEDLGSNFPASDGMIFDRQGNLYLGDLEHNAIVELSPALKMDVFAHDSDLLWPDTFAWSPQGELYVTCSQIQNMPWSHDGKNTRTNSYTLYKLK